MDYIFHSGKNEASIAGEIMDIMYIRFDFVHTSLLTRAIETTETILREMPDAFNGTIDTNWLLNERHFGALTGESKSHSNWTTHWDNCPPPMLPDHPYYERIHNDTRYDGIDDALPNAESLADTQKRFIQYWLTTIGPQVQAGNHVLVVAHQNLLRGVVQFFDALPEADASTLKVENSIPFLYKFDANLNPLNKFSYLY